MRGTGGRALEGVHEKESVAWSEPKESANDTERGERDRRADAASLTSTRSIVDSFWSWQPRHVGMVGSLRRFRPLDSSQSSKAGAQGEGETLRGDQRRECVLKSPSAMTGVRSSRECEKREDRACPFLGTT